MATSALSPVSTAVAALLKGDATLMALVTKVSDDVPQGTAFPYIYFEVREEDLGVFGDHGIPNVELRVHAFAKATTAAGAPSVAQSVINRVVALLRNAQLTVTGYLAVGRIFHDRTVPDSDQLVGGVKCHADVAFFHFAVEEA